MSKKKATNSNQSDAEIKQARALERVIAFKKLATKRTLKLLDYIELLERLSNRRSYSYDAEQVKKIFDVLEARFVACQKSFQAQGAKPVPTLEL
jgi:hypothetical protein